MHLRWLVIPILIYPLAAGAFNDIPDLIDGIPTNDAQTAKQLFNARVAREFPIGTKVGKIADALEDEGFFVDRAHGYAIFREYSKSCNRNWMIRWGRRSNIVTQRDADIMYNCE